MDSKEMVEGVIERHWMLLNDIKNCRFIDKTKKEEFLKNLKTNFYYYLKVNKANE